MRIFGDNSDGFNNEIEIEKALDFKTYEQLNPNLQHFLDDVFRGYDIRKKKIHAIRCRTNVKPDFYLHVDDIPKEVYVSIKKGSGNSIHQESLNSFESFLREENNSEEAIDLLKRFHFADGTNDNTGTIRQTKQEFLAENPDTLKILNEYFSSGNFLAKFFDRFLFVGNMPDAPRAEYLYHGNVHTGVWASREEILSYYKNIEPYNNAIYMGPFTYQVWNRNLKFNPKTENRRLVMQVKWGSLEHALIDITSRREEFRQNGTFEGDMNEKSCVIFFNRNPDNDMFKEYVNTLKKKANNILMIRVTTKQYSKLSNQKVMTRADAYAIEVIDDRLFNVLESNAFYLDEDILVEYQQYYRFIAESGVSIKLDNSDSYQLLKLSPNSFNALFGNYELGFGASLFCQKQEELPKNISLISGWHTDIESIQNFFDFYNISEEKLSTSIELCKSIKGYSNDKIKELVDSSRDLQRKIFNGIGLYDEPYTAWYFMQNKVIVSLIYIPFGVTTGSGRSRGDYSIVLKPKK